MTTGILGCALVAGLMAFAADKAQAGVVIGNVLYSPLKLKFTAQYTKSGKIKKFSVNNKEVLKKLGLSKDMLAVSRNTGDVWLINKTTAIENISVAPRDYLFVDFGTYVSTSKGNTYTEAGVTYVDLYDGGYLASGKDSANWFETSGVYSYKDNDGKIKNGSYQDNESMKAQSLTGEGYFSNTDFDFGGVPVSGSASYNGNGKLAVSSL